MAVAGSSVIYAIGPQSARVSSANDVKFAGRLQGAVFSLTVPQLDNDAITKKEWQAVIILCMSLVFGI